MTPDALLDELARCYARAAVDGFLADPNRNGAASNQGNTAPLEIDKCEMYIPFRNESHPGLADASAVGDR